MKAKSFAILLPLLISCQSKTSCIRDTDCKSGEMCGGGSCVAVQSGPSDASTDITIEDAHPDTASDTGTDTASDTSIADSSQDTGKPTDAARDTTTQDSRTDTSPDSASEALPSEDL